MPASSQYQLHHPRGSFEKAGESAVSDPMARLRMSIGRKLRQLAVQWGGLWCFDLPVILAVLQSVCIHRDRYEIE